MSCETPEKIDFYIEKSAIGEYICPVFYNILYFLVMVIESRQRKKGKNLEKEWS